MWANLYLQLPFKPFGRDRSGVDCWGLVALVYAEQLGLVLPQFDGVDPSDNATIADVVGRERLSWRPVALEARAAFDVVVMRARIIRDGRAMTPEMHLGIVTPERRILHIRKETGVTCVPVDHPSVARLIAGVYRR
jgi:hypothetical protein